MAESHLVTAEEARALLEGEPRLLAPFRVGVGIAGSAQPAILGGERQQHAVAWGVYAPVAPLFAAAPDLARTVIVLEAERTYLRRWQEAAEGERDAYRNFARRLAALMAPPDAVDLAVQHLAVGDLDLLAETVEQRIENVEEERDEVRRTLLNDRGEGAPPSEGWRWADTCWTRDLPTGEQLRVSWDATGLDTELPRWRCWLEPADDWGGDFLVPSAPSAREAMRSADLEMTESK